ncbi:MAG TPA: ABC transporter permease [Acidimicrobiia bacterium]
MSFIADVWQWVLDNFWGNGGILDRSIEHLQISGASVVIALLIALPPAVLLGHLGRGGTLAINLVNIGRAMPSFAILVIALRVTGEIGVVPTVIALVALAIPPIFTNTYIGLRDVDPEIREAAVGMGMHGTQVLRRIELPMAMPLVMAGVRTSTVQVIATATLATLIGWGGLGYYIIVGLRLNNNVQAFGGALAVVVLALLADLALAGVQRLIAPRGLQLVEPPWAVETAAEAEEPETEVVPAA